MSMSLSHGHRGRSDWWYRGIMRHRLNAMMKLSLSKRVSVTFLHGLMSVGGMIESRMAGRCGFISLGHVLNIVFLCCA